MDVMINDNDMPISLPYNLLGHCKKVAVGRMDVLKIFSSNLK